MTNTCDWTLVISALAIAIPTLIANVVLWLKAKTEFEHSKIRQYEMLDKTKDIIKEQFAVKQQLNGNNNLIPNIDSNVIEVKQDIKDLKENNNGN